MLAQVPRALRSRISATASDATHDLLAPARSHLTPLLEESPGRASVPLVRAREESDQFAVVHRAKRRRPRLRRPIRDLENPPIGPIVSRRVVDVALLAVVPVDHVNIAVRARLDADDLRPRVVGDEEVGRVRADEAGALGLQDVAVDPGAVDVIHEERAAVLGRPCVPLVDHRPRVGVAAARGEGRGGGQGRLAPPGMVADIADIVAVVRDRLDVVEGVGLEVLPCLPLVPGARDDVVEVRDHARGQEALAVGVEVEAPGVARAVGDDLEPLLRRVITPDAGVQGDAVLVGRTRLADLRVGEDAVAAVEPSIRPPDEASSGPRACPGGPSRRARPGAGRRGGRRRPCRG